MSASLKKVFTQTTENGSVSSKKVNHVVVDVEITEHEYMAFDRDDEMVGGESVLFNGDDFPGFIRITVDGEDIEFDEDALSDRSKYSDYESVDLGVKWNSDDIVKFGYYDNLAGKTWMFDVENFDIEKLNFYFQRFDVKFGLADYDSEEHRITLLYNGEEIEEDYDAYSCDNGEFEQEWCVYEDKEDYDDCCSENDEKSENIEEVETNDVSSVFGTLAYIAASLDGEVTVEKVKTILAVAEANGWSAALVAGSILIEKLGTRTYNHWSEVARSVSSEYHSDLMQGIILVIISDSKLKKIELDFVRELADVWELDLESVQQAVIFHVVNFNRAFPDRQIEVAKNDTQAIENWKSEYDEVMEVSNGYYVVQRNNMGGIADPTGKLLTPLKYEDFQFRDDVIMVACYDRWGLLDYNGHEIIPLRYDEILVGFDNGAAVVKNNGLMGFVGSDGKELISPRYKRICTNADKNYVVLENEKWGLVSLEGELLVEPQYDDFENIKVGYIKVISGDNVGVLNARGEAIVPVEFEECGTLESNKGTLIFIGHKGGEQFIFQEDPNTKKDDNEDTDFPSSKITAIDTEKLWADVISRLPEDIRTNVSAPPGRSYFVIKSKNGPKGVDDFNYVVNYYVRAANCAVNVETLNGGEKGKEAIQKFIDKADGNGLFKEIEPQQGAKNKNKWAWFKSEQLAGKTYGELVKWYVDTIVAFYRFFEMA